MAKLGHSNWKRKWIKNNVMALPNRMKGKLNIMQNIRVAEFRNPSLDRNVVAKIPCTESIEGYQFNQSAQRSPIGFLTVRGVVEYRIRKDILERVNGIVGHVSIQAQVGRQPIGIIRCFS